MVSIIINPSELWDYFHDHSDSLMGVYEIIAENELFGVEIFAILEDDMPSIVVTIDGEEIYREDDITKENCSDVAEKIYDDYLYADINDLISKDEYDKNPEFVMDEREIELDEAITYVLETFAPNYIDFINTTETLEDLKDLIAEYLYKNQNLSIYRPMFLEDDCGNEEFVEFPYPELDLG